MNLCALCNQPAPTYTLCDTHRTSLGITLRRDRTHHKRANGLPPQDDRPPRGTHLTEAHITTLRNAYTTHTLQQLADQTELSTFTIARIIRGIPGDTHHPTTIHKLNTWMTTQPPRSTP